MTRADFTRQANAICTHRKAQLAAVEARHQGNLGAISAAASPVLQDAVDKLEGLRPPARLKSEFESVMAFERLQVRAAKYYNRTGRILHGSTEDGPPLHRHEAMRVQLGMTNCNL